MKIFLRVISIILIIVGIIPCYYLAISNLKFSDWYIFINNWKIMLPSLISIFVGYLLFLKSN